MTATLPLIHRVSTALRDVSRCWKWQSCSPSTNTRKRLRSQHTSICTHVTRRYCSQPPGALRRRPYLERLVSDEGEEGDVSLGVPPESRHAGPADHLTIPETDAELQRHVGRRLPGGSTPAGQGDVEPEGGERTSQTTNQM